MPYGNPQSKLCTKVNDKTTGEIASKSKGLNDVR